MRLFFKFLSILWRKKMNPEDYYNFWLILFFGTTIEEQQRIYKDNHREFYANHIVSEREYNFWIWWATRAAQRSERRFFVERKFRIAKDQIGWISWLHPSRERLRNDLFLLLNAAPTVRFKDGKTV